MPIFRIDKQVETITELSFDVPAGSIDEAERIFHEDMSDGDNAFPIHQETIRTHWVISNVEELDYDEDSV